MNTRVLNGDWKCGHCGNNNFARRERCHTTAAPPTNSPHAGSCALSVATRLYKCSIYAHKPDKTQTGSRRSLAMSFDLAM